MGLLKIQVILPMYGGSLPIGRYCARALEHLGASVRVFDAPLLYPAYEGMRKLDINPSRLSQLQGSFLRLVSQSIWTQTQEFAPNLVLAMAQAPVDKLLLQRMKAANIRTVMWFVEDYRLFTYWQIYAPLYDAFAVIQKEPFLEKLAAIGQTHALYLPLAAMADFHKPVELTASEHAEFDADISFLGAGYPNRRLAFRPLADMDFKIWGNDWEDEKILQGNIQRDGARVNEEDAVKIYNGSKINLNLHSSIYTDELAGNGDFVNPRTFELASIGAFQLVDTRTLLPELFEEDEVATFKTIEEMETQIRHFLNHPQEREAYAKRARERVLKDHTYEKRMEQLLSYMEATFGPWARDDEPEDATMDPALAAKIKDLAHKLGLSVNAPFADITAKLRRQTGPLSELETAILFLEEWKKQYSQPHNQETSVSSR